MKTLEDLIKEERYRMDAEDPPTGHMERFEHKVNTNKFRHSPVIRMALSAAAVIMLLLFGYWYVQVSFFPESKTGTYSLSVLAPNYVETDTYYRNLCVEKKQELEKLPFSDNIDKQSLINELKELEKTDELLLKDLSKDPGNEAIIQAILEQYKTKIEILDNLLEQLSPMCNNVIFSNHENTGKSL